MSRTTGVMMTALLAGGAGCGGSDESAEPQTESVTDDSKLIDLTRDQVAGPCADSEPGETECDDGQTVIAGTPAECTEAWSRGRPSRERSSATANTTTHSM